MRLFVFSLLFILYQQLALAQPYVLKKTLEAPKQGIECMAVLEDRNLLVTGGTNGELIWWDLTDFSVIRRVKAHYNAAVNSIIFNKSGSMFVTAGGGDGKIRLWYTSTGKLISSYNAKYNSVNFAVLGPKGHYIYYGGYKTSYSIFYDPSSVFTGLYRVAINNPSLVQKLFSIPKESETNWGITDGNLDFSRKHIVFTAGHYIFLWDIENLQIAEKIKCPHSTNNVTTAYNTLYVWAEGYLYKYSKQGSDYKLIASKRAGDVEGEKGYSRMEISDNGKLMATGDAGNRVTLWHRSGFVKKQVLAGHHAPVRSFAFIRKDTVLLTGSYDGTINIWGYPDFELATEKTADTKPPVAKEQEKTTKNDTPKINKPKDNEQVQPKPKPLEKTEGVVFKENNIPKVIQNRLVELQGKIDVNSQTLTVLVWDRSIVDSDTISLSLNGEWVLKNYPLVKEKKKITLKLKPNTNNYLALYANNLGERPPNTAAISIIKNGKEQILSLSSTEAICGAINFVYTH